MGAAKSPPCAWEWSYTDRNHNPNLHPWGNNPQTRPDSTLRATDTDVGAASSGGAAVNANNSSTVGDVVSVPNGAGTTSADAITNAFSSISLGSDSTATNTNACATNPLTSAPSSSSSISLSRNSDPRTVRPRSVSEEALRATLGATTNAHARISPFQPSPLAEIDPAPSPVSLRPHPDQQRFHQSRHVSLDNIQLALASQHQNPYSQQQIQHQAQAQAQAQVQNHNAAVTHPNAVHHQMPLSAHPTSSISFAHTRTLPQAPYHSDSALTVHALAAFGNALPHPHQTHVPSHEFSSNSLLSSIPDSTQPIVTSGAGTGGGAGVGGSVVVSTNAVTRAKNRTGKAKIKNELYKTEICRSYLMNNGYCKYGAKCQFAHGDGERRPVRRHPRYKTKLCRNYVTTGTCPYGTRCRFIHACDLGQDENTSHLNFMIAASRERERDREREPESLLMYANAPSQNGISSSESHSSTSPASSNRLSTELYAPAALPETENFFAVHHRQNLINASIAAKPVATPVGTPLGNVRSVIGTGRTSPIRPFSLGRDNALVGDSPVSNAPRSRLPVFRTLSGGMGEGIDLA